jgi:hypothetical protein
MDLKRRDFLKYAGAGAGIAALPVELLWEQGLAFGQEQAPGLDPRLSWSKAPLPETNSVR